MVISRSGPEFHRASVWRWPMAVAVVAACVALMAACGSDAPDANGGSANGSVLYAERCAACHGADLRGTGMGPSQLSIVYEPNHHPDESFREAIRNGVSPHHWDFGPMPAVSGLDDDEITAIIAYIREVQQREGFEPYPPD
jgi:mono/diheme cytochrome c family protein